MSHASAQDGVAGLLSFRPQQMLRERPLIDGAPSTTRLYRLDSEAAAAADFAFGRCRPLIRIVACPCAFAMARETSRPPRCGVKISSLLRWLRSQLVYSHCASAFEYASNACAAQRLCASRYSGCRACHAFVAAYHAVVRGLLAASPYAGKGLPISCRNHRSRAASHAARPACSQYAVYGLTFPPYWEE